MKKKLIYSILFLSLLPLLSLTLYSQEAAKIKPYVTLQYFKNTDDQRILQTTLTYSSNRMELPLPGMEIAFYTGYRSEGYCLQRILPIIKELPGLNWLLT